MAQMALFKNLHVECDECGKKQWINKGYLDYDTEFLGERGMGAEIEHDFTGEFECKKCGSWMSIKIIGYEYPEGALNDVNTETRGCVFLENPEIGIDWSYEFDYPEYAEGNLYDLISDAELNIYTITNDPNRVYDLSPSEFEDLVAEVFRRRGFNVAVTPRTHDGGKDIIASYNMNGIPCMLIVECKRYAAEKKVGVEIVRALHGVQQAEHYGKAVVVTSSSFTRGARSFAGGLRDMIVLVDFQQLMDMIDETMSGRH